MRFNSKAYLALLLCGSGVADAGFIGAAARGIRSGVQGSIALARIGRSVLSLAQGSSVNMRTLSKQGVTNAQTAVRSAMSLSEKGKSRLKIALTTVTSGTVSGTVSGNISKDRGGGGGGGSKLRREGPSDRARMLSNDLLARQSEADFHDPPEPPEGVDPLQWEECFWQISTAAHIYVTGENNWIQIDGLPSECKDINNQIYTIPDSGAGVGCGDACIKYENLSPEDFGIMADYLESFYTQ